MKEHAAIIALVLVGTLCVIGSTLYLWHGQALLDALWWIRNQKRIKVRRRGH